MKALDQIASESRTVKLWVEILVKHVLLMMTYVRAEREGDWLRHLATFKKDASILLLCRSCKQCTVWLVLFAFHGETSPHIERLFLKGQHVTRHIQGIWNGLWSDQFIESTFMRYGHSVGGIIGITLKSTALKIWALSRHICC